MSGHGACTGDVSALCGKLSKVDAVSGTRSWTNDYSSCGVPNACGVTPRVIKNECWGLTALNDGSGVVVACGTGIENCDGLTGSMATNCAAGTMVGDTRAGAFVRPASVWQSWVFKTDAAGTLLWARADEAHAAGDPVAGSAGWVPVSSASEFVFPVSDGLICVQVIGTDCH